MLTTFVLMCACKRQRAFLVHEWERIGACNSCCPMTDAENLTAPGITYKNSTNRFSKPWGIAFRGNKINIGTSRLNMRDEGSNLLSPNWIFTLLTSSWLPCHLWDPGHPHLASGLWPYQPWAAPPPSWHTPQPFSLQQPELAFKDAN